MKNKRGLQGARRLFFVQIIASALVSFGVWLCFDGFLACSLLLGGMVWVLPQVCFAELVFWEQRARFSKAIVARAEGATHAAFARMVAAAVQGHAANPAVLGTVLAKRSRW